MPAKVAVNTEQIVISDGSSFLVTARDGSIDDDRPQGFFVRDTRLISYYETSLNRQPLQTNLAVGDAKVTLRFWREGEQTSWKVSHLDGELHIDLEDDK